MLPTSYHLYHENGKLLDFPERLWKAEAVPVFSCASPLSTQSTALGEASVKVLFKSYGIKHMVFSFAI